MVCRQRTIPVIRFGLKGYRVGGTPGVEACAAPPLDVDASDPLVFGLFLGGSELAGGSLSPPDLFLLFLPIFQSM